MDKRRKERTERKMAANELEVTINLGDLAEVKGRIETMLVVIGLQAHKYPQHLTGQFISECVELKQFDMLQMYKKSGVAYLDKILGDKFGDLVELFTQQEMENKLKANPQLATWKDGDPVISGTVEIVDKVPDVPGEVYMPGSATGKSETDPADKIQVMTREEHTDLHSAGRKNGPGVETAEKIRKATNAPVKKTGAARKATTGKTGGAADGK